MENHSCGDLQVPKKEHLHSISLWKFKDSSHKQINQHESVNVVEVTCMCLHHRTKT